MIGKPLSARARGEPSFLSADHAKRVVRQALASQGNHVVQVRARSPRMIACLVVEADRPCVNVCRTLGFEMALSGTGVFGVFGSDALRLFPGFALHQREWLETPCGARETKILLLERGLALVSLTLGSDGSVALSVAPQPRLPLSQPKPTPAF